MVKIKNTANILKTIIASKKQEVVNKLKITSLQKVIEQSYNALPVRGFYNRLMIKCRSKENAVIAEIKKASPSKGVLCKNFNPIKIAKSYENAGATCLSVITDKDFFQGSSKYLIDVRAAVSLPVLRKDFIISPYQVYESRSMNADCILLIAACLSNTQMQELSLLATKLSMDVLIEVHDEEQLDRVLELKPLMIGINNRNLSTFKVCLQTTINLCSKVSDSILIVTESGISSREDVLLMHKHNIYAYIVGEAFVKRDNPGLALREIFT